jgi:hypothetical protein
VRIERALSSIKTTAHSRNRTTQTRGGGG